MRSTGLLSMLSSGLDREARRSTARTLATSASTENGLVT